MLKSYHFIDANYGKVGNIEVVKKIIDQILGTFGEINLTHSYVLDVSEYVHVGEKDEAEFMGRIIFGNDDFVRIVSDTDNPVEFVSYEYSYLEYKNGSGSPTPEDPAPPILESINHYLLIMGYCTNYSIALPDSNAFLDKAEALAGRINGISDGKSRLIMADHRKIS